MLLLLFAFCYVQRPITDSAAASGKSESVHIMLRVSDIKVEARSAMTVPKVVKLLFPAPFEDGGVSVATPLRCSRTKDKVGGTVTYVSPPGADERAMHGLHLLLKVTMDRGIKGHCVVPISLLTSCVAVPVARCVLPGACCLLLVACGSLSPSNFTLPSIQTPRSRRQVFVFVFRAPVLRRVAPHARPPPPARAVHGGRHRAGRVPRSTCDDVVRHHTNNNNVQKRISLVCFRRAFSSPLLLPCLFKMSARTSAQRGTRCLSTPFGA